LSSIQILKKISITVKPQVHPINEFLRPFFLNKLKYCQFISLFHEIIFSLRNNTFILKIKIKMADYKLDKTDLKILKLLQENSKITNLDLSKKIGLSPAPTLERVKKLEQSGIILSYHAKVDSTAIGLNVKTYVLVSLAWQKPNALDNFIKKIKLIDEVTECYIITGDADFLLKIVCKDIANYEKLLFKTLSQIEEIERLKTLMTLSKVKKEKVLPFDYENDME